MPRAGAENGISIASTISPYKPAVLLSPLRIHPKPDDAKMQHSVGKGKRGTSPRLWKLNGMYILHPHFYAHIHTVPYLKNTLVSLLLKKLLNILQEAVSTDHCRFMRVTPEGAPLLLFPALFHGSL